MKQSENKIVQKLTNPFILAAVFYLIALLVIGFTAVGRSLGFMDVEDTYPWIIMAVLTLLFNVSLAMLVVYRENISRSIQYTVYSYVLMVVIGALSAWWFSGLSLKETGTFREIYVLLIVVFSVVLVLAVGYKSVLGLIEQRDNMKLAREREADESRNDNVD